MPIVSAMERAPAGSPPSKSYPLGSPSSPWGIRVEPVLRRLIVRFQDVRVGDPNRTSSPVDDKEAP